MRKTWLHWLQTFIGHHFQVDRVALLFVKDQTLSMTEYDELLEIRNADAKTTRLYKLLVSKDESKLDVFVKHLREVGNLELANELERGIGEERARLATISPTLESYRARSSTLSSSLVSSPETSHPPVSPRLSNDVPQLSLTSPIHSPAPFDTQRSTPLPISGRRRVYSQSEFLSPEVAQQTSSSWPSRFAFEPDQLQRMMEELDVESEEGLRLTVDKPEVLPAGIAHASHIPRTNSFVKSSSSGNSFKSQTAARPPGTPLLRSRIPEHQKTWSQADKLQLRTTLFKAFDNARYCDACIRDAICDRIENWLTSPITDPKDHLLTLLFIGPSGTGKHKLLKAFAQALRCDMFNNVEDLSEQEIGKAKDLSIVCTEGYSFEKDNSLSVLSTLSHPDRLELRKSDNQYSKYFQNLKERRKQLRGLFQTSENDHQFQSSRVLHVVIQDSDDLFELTPRSRFEEEARTRSRSASFGTSNHSQLEAFNPSPQKYFTSDFANLFSDNGVYIFWPIASQEDELSVVARDLNNVSAFLEQQSYDHMSHLVGDFIDNIVHTVSSTEERQRIVENRPKLVSQLMSSLTSWNSEDLPGGLAHSFGHRMTVGLFKSYQHFIARTRDQPRRKRFHFPSCFGTKHSQSEQLPDSSDEDMLMLEELRKLIKSKGAFSKKCYQTILDVMSQQLGVQSDQLKTCAFVVKLQLGTRRNTSPGAHGQFKFELAGGKQHNSSFKPRNLSTQLDLRTTFHEVDRHLSSGAPRPNSAAVILRSLNCASGGTATIIS